MESNLAAIRIARVSLSGTISEDITIGERATRDFKYYQEIEKIYSDIEEASLKTDAKCNPDNKPYYPNCKYKYSKQIEEIMKEALSNAIPENARSSEKIKFTLEYLEEIRKNPSLIIPLLQEPTKNMTEEL